MDRLERIPQRFGEKLRQAARIAADGVEPAVVDDVDARGVVEDEVQLIAQVGSLLGDAAPASKHIVAAP